MRPNENLKFEREMNATQGLARLQLIQSLISISIRVEMIVR